jgi:hypothetical protein
MREESHDEEGGGAQVMWEEERDAASTPRDDSQWHRVGLSEHEERRAATTHQSKPRTEHTTEGWEPVSKLINLRTPLGSECIPSEASARVNTTHHLTSSHTRLLCNVRPAAHTHTHTHTH